MIHQHAEIDVPPSHLTLEGKVDAYSYNPSWLLDGASGPYRARGIHTNSEYVIKRKSGCGPGFALELAAYQKIQQTGRHTSLFQVVEVIEKEEDSYIIFPYVYGQDLVDFLDLGTVLSISEFFAILQPLCGVLEFLHQARILHRDIRQENIRLQVPGETDLDLQKEDLLSGRITGIYLYDFNISTVADSFPVRIIDYNPLGTIKYIAPELWRGRPMDHRVDLYAVSILAFTALAGQYPYSSSRRDWKDQALHLKKQHLHAPIPSAYTANPLLPPTIDYFFEKGLAKNPEDRFQSAAELKEAYLAFC